MNYYNEIEPSARKWLRQLVKDGLIPDGYIDNRPIQEVSANELGEFAQCHFFAGIGGWAYALRLAGVPDDEPLWTGSCPCQPWSKGNLKAESSRGFSDSRHLWPTWDGLINEYSPPIVLGEQVADAVGKGWWDVVASDMEKADYACGAIILPACAYGADHERQRLFWVADTGRPRRQRLVEEQCPSSGQSAPQSIYCNPLARARRALAGDFADLLSCNGISIGVARGEIKGYGNAIVPQVAAAFIRSVW